MTPTNPTDAQMKLARECAEIVIITREDRDATAEYLGYPKEHFEPDGNMELDLIRAFARHRLATEARAQGLVEAERERCARIVERRAEARFAENGTREWDTNATYYQGGMAEIYEALDEEADEIAAAIRNQHSQHGGDGKGEIECTLWKK